MDKATKAALFSAFLFPGWGQFYLKRYLRGLIFLLPVLAGTMFLARTIVQSGMKSMKELTLKDGILRGDDIVQITVGALQAIDSFYLFSTLGLIVVLWIVSIIDAYRLGTI